MSNFIRYPKFFHTKQEAEAVGGKLAGDGGVFKVRRIPAAPIEDVGPGGVCVWQKVAEYAVFTNS